MFKLLVGIFIFATSLICGEGEVAHEVSLTIGVALIAAGLDTIIFSKE